MSQRLLLLPFLLVGSFVGTGCRSEPAPPPAPATSLARPERARPARPQPPPLGQVTEDPEVLARLVAEGTRVAFAARTRTLAWRVCEPLAAGGEECALEWRSLDAAGKPERLTLYRHDEDRAARLAPLLGDIARRFTADGFVGLRLHPWPAGTLLNFPGALRVRWEQSRIDALDMDGALLASWEVQPRPRHTTRLDAVAVATGVPHLIAFVRREPAADRLPADVATTEPVVLPLPAETVANPLIPLP
ncbi:MAG: hypothetical protein RBU45_13605 [Myxococcota bacterium]|jgi:hypothetical protein|nr:hypothetical protein [Myxococcota bacterium]